MSKNYDNDIMNIVNIGFSVFSNKDILLNSATEQDINGITLPDSYENSEPKRNGLVDPRLGISERHLDCATCGLNSIHFLPIPPFPSLRIDFFGELCIDQL